MRTREFVVAVCILALCLAPAAATKLLHMNLQKMCDESASVFRGTVVSIDEGWVPAGGGTIPSVTVVMRVDQALKGNFDTVKGVQLTQFRMLGTRKIIQGEVPSPIPGLPQMKIGESYLLLVAPEGPTGLTSTVGLGQGCFEILAKDGQDLAVNSFGNAGLFKGMNVSGMPPSGPVDYTALANLITQTVEGGN